MPSKPQPPLSYLGADFWQIPIKFWVGDPHHVLVDVKSHPEHPCVAAIHNCSEAFSHNPGVRPVQVRSTDSTVAVKRRILRSFRRSDFHTAFKLWQAVHAFFFLVAMSSSEFLILAPRYRKSFTSSTFCPPMLVIPSGSWMFSTRYFVLCSFILSPTLADTRGCSRPGTLSFVHSSLVPHSPILPLPPSLIPQPPSLCFSPERCHLQTLCPISSWPSLSYSLLVSRWSQDQIKSNQINKKTK